MMIVQLDRLMAAVDLPGLRFGVLPEFRQTPQHHHERLHHRHRRLDTLDWAELADPGDCWP